MRARRLAARCDNTAARVSLGLVLATCLAIAACSQGGSDAPTPAPTTSSAAPTPTPEPPVPVRPGTARGELLVVQRAEDASLVSGGDPIRLTLARTQNLASWFTAPPQRLAGTMTTEEALLTLGWRPADDGTTAPLPKPQPNGLLATASGDLAIVVLKANVRADGTLVLDIRPIGDVPETTSSLGPVSLSLDGVPGVLQLVDDISADLQSRVIVTGRRNQQAVVQFVGTDGEVVQSGFLATDRDTIEVIGDIEAGTTRLIDAVVQFIAPTQTKAGSVTISGRLVIDGAERPLTRVVARWSLPKPA